MTDVVGNVKAEFTPEYKGAAPPTVELTSRSPVMIGEAIATDLRFSSGVNETLWAIVVIGRTAIGEVDTRAIGDPTTVVGIIIEGWLTTMFWETRGKVWT